jgi:predicted membrane-bound spermidine synthase
VPSEPRPASNARNLEIFFVSVLILHLELALIRWIGTEIRVFAYLGNLVLVVCFFGVGLGCYQAGRPIRVSRVAINLLLLTILIANPLRWTWLDLTKISEFLGGFEDSPIWYHAVTDPDVRVVGALAGVGVITYLVAMTFVPLGQVLGRALQDHPRTIRAYSINIAGSLAGILLFQALGWLSLPPAAWLLAAAAVAVPLTFSLRAPAWQLIAGLGVTAVLAWMAADSAKQTVWSPYHKLLVWPFHTGPVDAPLKQGYVLEANGSYYQQVVDLSDDFLRAHPNLLDPDLAATSHYNMPFAFKPDARRVLILGAGMGNNAAAALRHGAERVDCVEIDPQIFALGRALHPERPYDSPRVHMIVNDARAFLKHNREQYDLIWFALLDARLLGSSYTNLRIDHYVYTLQSFEEARRALADDGLLVLHFDHERRWIADRLFVLLRDVFGHPPLVYFNRQATPPEYGVGGNATMLAAQRPVSPEVIGDSRLREFVRHQLVELPGQTRPTTDDWPYLYLQDRRIPRLHLLSSLAILVAVVLAQNAIVSVRRGLDWHFFALGVAFLLLQVQTVSRATLLFGMTWVVNSIVIAAVLVMILAANLIAARWPRLPARVALAGLGLSIAALAIVPLDLFNALTGPAKLVAASAFLTAPIFFAGLIFIRSFAACPDKAAALGSNLLGALVGGLLESLSFLTGIRALILLVALAYMAAVWTRPDNVRAEPLK